MHVYSPLFTITLLFLLRLLFYKPPKEPPKPVPPKPKPIPSKSNVTVKVEPIVLTPPIIVLQPLPASMWGINARSRIPSEWAKLSRYLRESAKGVCTCCQAEVGVKHLEAHEVWEFPVQDGLMTQKLVDIQVLCVMCHRLAHPARYYFQHQEKLKKVRDSATHSELRMQGHAMENHYKSIIRSKMTWQNYCFKHSNISRSLEKSALSIYYAAPLEVQQQCVRRNGDIIPFELDLTYLNKFNHIINVFMTDKEIGNVDMNKLRSYE